MEKIFWALVAVLFAGLMAFLAFGAGAGQASAATQQPVNSYYAGLPQAAAQAAPVQGVGGQPAAQQGGVQVVQLSVSGGSYMPNPIRVKKVIPVRMVADIANMPGCSKSIVMAEFGIHKTVSEGDNIIEFTPSESGTFQFSCSMNMYRGTVIVENSDGTVAQFSGKTPSAAAGNLGGSAGGCGCGG